MIEAARADRRGAQARHQRLQAMRQRLSLVRMVIYYFNIAEFGLAAQCNVKDNVGDCVLRVDFDFCSNIGLEVSLLLKEGSQGNSVQFHIFGIERRLGWKVSNLYQPGIVESLGSGKLKDPEVYGRL